LECKYSKKIDNKLSNQILFHSYFLTYSHMWLYVNALLEHIQNKNLSVFKKRMILPQKLL